MSILEAPPLPFTYWSDPLCIWAYVGQPKLDAVIEKHGQNIAVRHRIVPVFTSIPRRFSEGGTWAKAGPSGRRKTTADVAQKFGFDNVTGAVWESDAPSSSVPAGAAFHAVALLEEREEASIGAAALYLEKLRERFFVDDKNIARRVEQCALAEEMKTPMAAFEAALDDGSALTRLLEDLEDKTSSFIRGSPTWVFDDGRTLLYGNVASSVVHGTIDELLRGHHTGCSWC
ncbi:MAG: hypothetical protein GY822_30585 [Deltaproteobacteria bacterium]|nr:hypothetical protein [Deltaproteobacteria bacterium]